MGTCKDEMKPKNDEGKKLFGLIKSKKNKDTTTDKAETFADNLALLDKKLDDLILVKENECSNEKGRESYNDAALVRLQAMRTHLDGIIELAAEYSDSN